MLGLAFLFMAGLGAMVEERGGLGGGRGILNNPDLKPQSETTTKFADVKGVDEAKVGVRVRVREGRGAVGRSVGGWAGKRRA